jgi:hypothetical protein
LQEAEAQGVVNLVVVAQVVYFILQAIHLVPLKL